MPKLVTPLTDSKIKSEIAKCKKAAEKSSIKLFDGGGLHFYIDKNSGTYWRFDYTRPVTKKRNTMSIGVYPDITLAQARLKRDEFKSLLAQGIDPQVDRKREEQQKRFELKNTFEAIALDFMQTEEIAVSTRTRNEIIYRYLFQAIGHKPVNEISAIELLDVCRIYEKQGKFESAKRIRSKASQVFKYALALGLCERNVAQDIQGLLRAGKVNHYAAVTDPDELGRLLQVIDTHQDKGSIVVAYALKILPHVFVRPGELRFAKWADIDLDKNLWCYTPAKTENAIGTQHIVPLSKQVAKLFKELQLLNGSKEYCFSSGWGKSDVISESSINKALKKVGINNGETTGHGFRATARTLLDEVLRFPIERIEQQLAHQVKDMHGRAYNRTKYLEERTEMMQAWSDYLDSLKNKASD